MSLDFYAFQHNYIEYPLHIFNKVNLINLELVDL